MRIVIDLQAAQSTGSRSRGIGRYSLSLALAMARSQSGHELFVVLNGLFPATIEPIREAFAGLLPQENIRVWHGAGPVADLNAENDWRRQSTELLREAFLASLKPDMVHVSSLFEGLGDDAVTSIGALLNIPTAVTLYDLIPFVHRKPYLDNPAVEAWYLRKLEHLCRADLWLAISESSRQEGINYLGLPDNRSINISTDADAHFQPIKISLEADVALRKKYDLHRPFIMYTGGIDHRKNIEGLIRAYSKLPRNLRRAHQLAIVCSSQPGSRRMLEQLAAQQGLSKEEVVLTGFVPEEDLLLLYNLCTLFVFPSWHEGFGLPALEAMRCGVPVIGADSSSLPEVIGWKEALFDPHSDEAIGAHIARALIDNDFRSELVRRGAIQAQSFSWAESARRAITAMEKFHAERQNMRVPQNRGGGRPRLAYVSPLPPERSGISDYSAELLPELARLYKIDVIVSQDSISDPWVNANCSVRTVQWFFENANHYDRVLYHFGNSTFHQHMFDLLKAIPGIVVLHDFFLSGILSHIDSLGFSPGRWARELYSSHGYAALSERFHAPNTADVVWKYPCSLSVIQDSLGVIAHSPYSHRLAEEWYGVDSADWAMIPLVRNSRLVVDKIDARKAIGFGLESFLVCAFGILGPHKLNHRLLQAFLNSRLVHDKNCHLIFVGENHPGEYGRELLEAIQNSPASHNIHVAGWVDFGVYRQYLAAADIGVQLRTLSRGETSAAVLDCMSHGLATIVNSNGSMGHLDGDAVWKLPDLFTDEQLIEALETLWVDGASRRARGESGREIIVKSHNPRVCADQYGEAIERLYQSAASGLNALQATIAGLDVPQLDNLELIRLAEAMAISLPVRSRGRQLLVDVSELVQRDSKSGIQRVVRSVLREWLINPPTGLRIEPVYATNEGLGYRYARQFSLGFLECPTDLLLDEVIEYSAGDIFLGLDMQHEVVSVQQDFYQQMRRQGVCVKFIVYDLLPISLPKMFPPGSTANHSKWLKVVAQSDGAICISKTVADELKDWVQEAMAHRRLEFAIDWFHLGADVENSLPSRGLPANRDQVLQAIKSRTTFIMVGTIEPRKGHAQILEAFEQLWRAGLAVNLVIVGKTGWVVEGLIARLLSHVELNKRFFLLEGISDEFLEEVYSAATCLVAASEGEGFGLPLIEAAQHRLPIIARDISVFREVAGEYAYYFPNDRDPFAISKAIHIWLDLFKENRHPKSDNMPWITWKKCADQLKDLIIK